MKVWAGVAVAMGWAQPDHPEIRELAAAPGALRSAAARAVGEAMRRASRTRALALVIEPTRSLGRDRCARRDRVRDPEGGRLPDLGVRDWTAVCPGRDAPPGRAAPRAASSTRYRRWIHRRRPSSRAGCSRPPRTFRRARSGGSPNAHRAYLCCWSSWCAASSATVWFARRSAARRGTWRPTSSSASPICRSCSGCSSRETESLPASSCSRTRGWRRISRFELSAEELEGVQQALDRRRRLARVAARRQHRSASPDRERDFGAPPRRPARVPPFAAARHRLPGGAARRARRDPPRGLRLLPAPGAPPGQPASAADGFPRRTQRPQGRGRTALSRPREPRARAPRLSRSGAAVPQRDGEPARRRQRGPDRRLEGARLDALPPRAPRGRAQGPGAGAGARPQERRAPRADRHLARRRHRARLAARHPALRGRRGRSGGALAADEMRSRPSSRRACSWARGARSCDTTRRSRRRRSSATSSSSPARWAPAATRATRRAWRCWPGARRSSGPTTNRSGRSPAACRSSRSTAT